MRPLLSASLWRSLHPNFLMLKHKDLAAVRPQWRSALTTIRLNKRRQEKGRKGGEVASGGRRKSIFKAVLMKGYYFSQLTGREERGLILTGRTFACMKGEKKQHTNLLFAAHLHSSVTSLISTEKKIWNNV